MKRKILIILGGILLFDVVFFAALFLMLPTDSISHLLEAHIERALKQEQIVKIGDLSITPWMTATVSQFQMTPINSAPVDESLATQGGNFNGFYCAPYVEQQPISIDEIYVNPDVFGILAKKYGGSFEMKILDGKVDGEVRTKGSIVEVKANGKKISLNEFALVSNFSGMQVYGDLEFAVRAILNAGLKAAEEENKDAENAEAEAGAEESDKKSGRKNRNRQNRNQRKSKSGDSDSMLAEANIGVKSSMTALCPKRLKLGSIPLDLPFTVFGNIEAELELKENKLIINKLTSDGPDIKLDVKGDVLLKSKTNANPRLNIHAVIQPSESWVTDNGMKIIYQMCEKHPDGSIELDLRGPVNRLKHDCGTPIPEPEPEKPEAKNADADKDGKDAKDNKAKDDKVKEEKKDSAKREKKKPMKAELTDRQSTDRPAVEKNGFSPDSVMHVRADKMLEETANERAERGSRRSRAGGSSAVPSPSEFKTRSARVNQDLERVNEMATQDMRRRGRGRERERMPNFGRGVPTQAE